MKRVKRLVALVLCCILFFSSILHANATIELSAPINLYVYSVDGEKYVGDFIVYNGVLGVEVNTLKKMHKDIKFVDVPENSDDHICIQRGDKKVTYRVEEVLDMDYSVYFPFEKTMFMLDLWIQMPVEGTLVVKDPPQLQAVFETLDRIVNASKYDMPHWWGTKQAEEDLKDATRADGFLGLKFGYLTGAEQRDQYQTACANILIPQTNGELDKLQQTTETVKLFKSMYGTVSTFEDLLEKSGVSIYSKPAKLDALDIEGLFKTEEMLNIFAYTCCVQEVQNGLDNGLSYVIRNQKPYDKHIVDGATLAIGMLTEELNVFEAAITKIAMNGFTWAMDVASGKFLPVKAFTDLVDIILNEAIGHKKVVDGMIMAHRYLAVQEMCVQGFNELWNQCNAGISYATYSGHESQQLQTLIDVVKVYMKAGVMAWLASAYDDVAEEAAQAQVAAMDADLALLDSFPKAELYYTDNYRSVTQAIIACASTALEDFDVYELPKETAAEADTTEQTDVTAETNITVEVSWDCDYNGQYRFVDTWVYGYADSGEMVERAETEGVYLAGEEAIAMQEVYEDHTKLTFLGVNGEYRVEIGNFDDYMTKNWHINEYDLKVTVYVPGQEPMVITDDPENYYMRGMDSYWYYCFGVVDGEITSLIWNP